MAGGDDGYHSVTDDFRGSDLHERCRRAGRRTDEPRAPASAP